MLNSRAVSVDLDRVDAVFGEAAALQEGAVVTDLHALTGEVTGLKQLDAVVLAMLSGDGQNRGRTNVNHRHHRHRSERKLQKTAPDVS